MPEPIKLVVEDAPMMKARLDYHPQNDLGMREIETKGNFYVSRNDFSDKEGHVVRLKDLYNVKVEKVEDTIHALYHSRELMKTEKFQWVTDDSVSVSVDVVGPLFIDERYNPESLKSIQGLAEKACEILKEGDVVQFERFGFVRLDDREEMRFILAHR